MTDQRLSLLGMLKQLCEDMLAIQQLGAGYYSCTPIIVRYNKLLHHAKELSPAKDGLVSSFEPIPEDDPLDPADKMKVVQAIRIEIGQLLSLLETQLGGDDEYGEQYRR